MNKSNLQARLFWIPLFVLLTILLAVFLMPTAAGVAEADCEIDFDSYTDSAQKVVDGNSVSIETYIATAYKSRISLDAKTNTVVVNGDDPITAFVPKELFTTNGTWLHAGKEYGFFIRTFQDVCQREALNSKRSIVAVFSIKFSDKSNTTTTDTLGLDVNMLFQREYVTSRPGDTQDMIGLADFSDPYANDRQSWANFCNYAYGTTTAYHVAPGTDVSQGLVFPAQQGNFVNPTFADVNLFYLSDINVAAFIKNQQDLNETDFDYNVNNDKGSFFTETKVDLQGRNYSHTDGNIAAGVSHTAQFVGKKVFSTMMGCVPGGAVINAAVDCLEYISGMTGYFASDSWENVAIGTGVCCTANPNTKSGQMEVTGGRLYKAAVVNSRQYANTSVWFGTNDYFNTEFKLSNSTGNENGWRTAVYHTVDLTVSSLYTDIQEITTTSGVYENSINPVRIKALSENETLNDAYIMPVFHGIDGKEQYSFVPQNTGFYNFSIQNSNNFDSNLTLNGDTVENSGNNYFLNGGTQYILTLKNLTSALQRPSINVSMSALNADFNNQYSLSIPVEDMICIKLDLANKFTRATIQGAENVVFLGMSDVANLPVNLTELRHIDLIGSGEKYLWIRNNDESVQNVNIGFININSITANIALQSVNEFYPTVVRLSFDKNFLYEFNFVSNTPNACPDYNLYDSNGEKLVFNKYVSQDNLKISSIIGADDGELFVAVRGADSCNLQFSKVGIYGGWFLNDKPLSEFSKDSEGAIKLEKFANKTASYHVYYKTQTGVVFDEPLFYTGDTTGITFNTYTDVLTISPNSSVNRNNISFVLNGKPEQLLSLRFTIRRAPSFDFQFSKSPLCLKLYYDSESNLQFFVINIIYNGVKSVYNCNPIAGAQYYDLSSIVQSNFYNLKKLAIDVKVASYTLSNDQGETYLPSTPLLGLSDGFLMPSTGTLNLVFTSGLGNQNSPFIITNKTELQSINSFSSSNLYYKLGADINLGMVQWTPLNAFGGNLDGGNHSIYGLKMLLSDEKYTEEKFFGLFAKNNGIIHNLTISSFSISSATRHDGEWATIGVIAGVNSGLINYCTVYGNIADKSTYIRRQLSVFGGIAGKNSGTIHNCQFGNPNGTRTYLYGNSDTGGIAGQSNGTIYNCSSNNIRFSHFVSHNRRSIGGVVGYQYGGILRDCSAINCTFDVTGYASIDIPAPSMGYIVGCIVNSTYYRFGSSGCSNDVSKLVMNGFPNSLLCAFCFKGVWGELGQNAGGNTWRTDLE